MQNNNPAYDKLIMADGQPQFGRFLQPMQEINYEDFEYLTVMDKPARRWQKHFAFNQFEFIGIHSERFSLCVAIANVRYVASAFVYLFDRHDKQITQQRWLQPLALNCRMSDLPHSGISTFRKGKNRLSITRNETSLHLLATLDKDDALLDLMLSKAMAHSPLSVCTRSGYNGWTYTEKLAGLNVEGNVKWRQHALNMTDKDELQALGTSDWSCGFMRRETAWNWASGCGHDSNGNTIGLNLAAGVNETAFNENGFWVNGKLFPLGHADFRFQRKDRLLPWQIRTDNASLTFHPQGQFQDKANAWIVASNFSQLPGYFSGTLQDSAGQIYSIDALPGVVEDHFARW